MIKRTLKRTNHFFAAAPAESEAPRFLEVHEPEPGVLEDEDSDPLMLLPVDFLALAFWEDFANGFFLIMSSETTTSNGFRRPWSLGLILLRSSEISSLENEAGKVETASMKLYV